MFPEKNVKLLLKKKKSVMQDATFVSQCIQKMFVWSNESLLFIVMHQNWFFYPYTLLFDLP